MAGEILSTWPESCDPFFNVVATQIFVIFTPGEMIPILTSIFFQTGWFNHQLVILHFYGVCVFLGETNPT